MTKTIAILGAGAIGGYLAAAWVQDLSAAGARVLLVGNPDIWANIGPELTVTGGPEVIRTTAELTVLPAAEALPQADIVFCAMKSTALDRAVADIRAHASKSAMIISLMNGLSPVRTLREKLPDYRVCAGMVPFNVVWDGPATLKRSSVGNLALEDGEDMRWLAMAIGNSGAPLALHHDLTPVQYGKLLLNLINPINALSGLTLFDMLSNRTWRLIYAATLAEALQVYDAAGVAWVKAGPFSPKIAARLLALPDWLFNATILRIQGIRPGARTSMAADILAGRATEIDALTGEILVLAEQVGQAAPINAGLVAHIREAEGQIVPPAWQARDLAERLGIPV